MYTYKTVPAPTNLVVNSDKEREGAVSQFSSLINAECVDGWEFYSMESITVSQKPGCLAAMVGGKETHAYFNMLVFRKKA